MSPLYDNRLVVERVDPIMSLNQVAGHVHTINGGSNFSPTATHTDLRNSVCSSCMVKEDMSVYWTPNLYFAHKDGSFQSVTQTGGSLIYYLFRFNALDKNKVVQAFPAGLKMVSQILFSYECPTGNCSTQLVLVLFYYYLNLKFKSLSNLSLTLF